MMYRLVLLVTTLPLDQQAAELVQLGWLTWMAIHQQHACHAWLARLR
jgi:hypothetical protein